MKGLALLVLAGLVTNVIGITLGQYLNISMHQIDCIRRAGLEEKNSDEKNEENSFSFSLFIKQIFGLVCILEHEDVKRNLEKANSSKDEPKIINKENVTESNIMKTWYDRIKDNRRLY
ncbi:uncharacterized protein [Anoplolepis gracilipes]|uniref:uncharacterized protein n=1 Tax=Anoplolepis gracilipes TaxID=354296 RepID=UPI003B9F28B2